MMTHTTTPDRLMRKCSAIALAVALSLSAVSVSAEESARHSFQITPKSTAAALDDFSRQAGIQVLYNHDVATKTKAPTVQGAFSRREALEKILSNSGLEVAEVTDQFISLKVKERLGGSPSPQPTSSETILEVVVTGSHIRNAPSTSPSRAITRQDIVRSGFSQTADLVRSLPETFTGGQNPGVMQNPTSTSQNLFNSSTINLRGIGSDATLVLINGHRMASEGTHGGIDISGIPLGALERLEIVTDGASALYGSDAVAGVANFILRKDVDGIEVGARIGGATEGDGFEQSYNVLAGKTWTGGNLLFNADFARQDEVLVADRAPTQSAPAFNNLLRPYERKSFYLGGEQKIGDRLTFAVDALYNAHEADGKNQNTATANTFRYLSKVTTYFVAPSLSMDLFGDWKASLALNYARGQGSYKTVRGVGAPSLVVNHSETRYMELNANGTLFDLPSGAVKLALGTGYRDEEYKRTLSSSTWTALSDRSVKYLYGEVSAPLVSPDPTRTGLEALNLSLSARTETYDLFGSKSTYKVGLRYEPFDNLVVRGTRGTSFKAPTMYQLSAVQNASLYPATTLGGTGPGTGLFLSGGNSDLRPETSTNWTVGIDWRTGGDRPVRLSATYFDIEYEDRVVSPISPFTQALSNPVFTTFLTANPTVAEVNDAVASVFTFFNNTGATYDPASVVAIIENRNYNATGQHISGVDYSVRKRLFDGPHSVDVHLNGTDLTIEQTTIPGAPKTEVSGVLFGPPNRRLRGGGTWSHQSWSATVLVNYLSSATDNYIVPNAHIASWTTVDFNLNYSLPVLGGLETSLSVINLFDNDPPYARGGTALLAGSYFDSTNTSAIGRFAALSVKKRF